MLKKFPFLLLFLLLVASFIVLTPQNSVWGGWSWQTVPTLASSRTPTVTQTITATRIFTATFTRTAITPSSTPGSSTSIIMNTLPVSPSVTLSASVTEAVNTSSTMSIKATNSESMQTSTVNDETIKSTMKSPTSTSTMTPTEEHHGNIVVEGGPPVWLLPLACSIVLVTILLIARLLFRKRT